MTQHQDLAAEVAALAAPDFFGGWPPSWISTKVVDEHGSSNTFLGPIGGLTVRTFGSSTTVLGDVWGNVFVDGPADGNDVNILGFVDGDVVNDDGWRNTIQAWGVEGSIRVLDSRDTSVSAGFADSVFATDSIRLNFDIGQTAFVSLNDVDDSAADFGSLGTGSVSGNGNDVNIDFLFGYLGISGDDTSVNIGYSSDATINNRGNENRIEVEGDAFIFDSGNSTQFIGGEGENTVVAYGNGTSLYNGGNENFLEVILGIGKDTFVDSGGGIDVIAGFEEGRFDTNGHVVVLDDSLEFSSVDLGPVEVDLGLLMDVFGQADGNDAVLDFNGGSVTLVGAADDYFSPQPPQDFFDFV